jgi:hypothetical protein
MIAPAQDHPTRPDHCTAATDVDPYRGRGLPTFGLYLAISLIYFTFSFFFFGRSLVGHFSDRFIGRDADPPQMMWLLTWWPYALEHHLNPFLTDYVWAPVGFNFAWMTSTPLAAILAAPLTKIAGMVASLNILTLLGTPSAALSAFILCKRISRSFWPAMVGGFVFGFSSYMLAQTLGHLNLILVFPIPLATYLVVRWLEGSLSARRFVAFMAMVLTCEFLIDLEVLATATLVGAIALALAMRYSPRESRARLFHLIRLTAVGYAIMAVAMIPYLYYFFAFGSIHQPLWPSERFSTDLLNFVLPTPVQLFGAIGAIKAVSSHFTGTIIERNGFIAFPLIAITVAWARRHWKEPLCKTIVISTVIVCVAAIGPYLQVAGQVLVPMPWLLVSHIPMLQHALPSRLMVFPPLAFAVIVSLWLADPKSRIESKVIASALTIVLMLPNPSAGFWTTPIDTPAFFTDGSAGRYLSRADVVLTLPWGSQGNSMLWQAECGMCFRNVSGYTAMERFEVRRWPIVNYFLGARDLPEPELQLKAFLANTRVTAVVLDDGSRNEVEWSALLSTLGVTPTHISGVSLYRLTPGLWNDYHTKTGLEMEERAIRLRLNQVIVAADKYLAAGHEPGQISSGALVELSLLPAPWRLTPDDFPDMQVLPWESDGVLILQLGSKSALAQSIDRYRDESRVIYLPYPHILVDAADASGTSRFIRNALLPPAAMPIDGESMEYIGIAFDREQLHKAAVDITHGQEHRSRSGLAVGLSQSG